MGVYARTMLSYLICAALFRPVALQVNGIEPGELVRYPLVLVRGSAAGPAVAIGRDWKHATQFPVVEGRFAGFVELKPGVNYIVVGSGKETIKMRMDYRPMKTPYAVQSVYMVAKDEGTDYDGPAGIDRTKYRDKLDTALKMMQAVAAESMKEAGYGRKTFPLRFDPDGKVHVEVVKTDLTGEELRKLDGNALWSHFYYELDPKFPFELNKVCAVMSFTRWDPVAKKGLAHTALGGGGLGLFGGGTMWSWPTTLADIPKVFADARAINPDVEMDDTGLRGTVWASASTAIGAMLHEMGHTFGLPHSTDPRSAMSRGFDLLNRRFTVLEPPTRGSTESKTVWPTDATHWDRFEAARLNLHPWFQADANGGKRFLEATPPTLKVNGDSIRIDAPYGLKLVGAVREGQAGVFKEFNGEKSVTVLRKDYGPDPGALIAVDAQGNQREISLP